MSAPISLQSTMFALTLMMGGAGTLAAQNPGRLEAASASEVLAEDTLRTTAEDSRFVAPSGWTIKQAGPATILTAPEGDSHIALIEVTGENAEAALAAAWVAYSPHGERQLKTTKDWPPGNGWGQIRSYVYSRSPDTKRAVTAQTMRRSSGWTVVILDMTDAISEKRGAQIGLILSRLQPKDYVPEIFAGQSPLKLNSERISALREFIETAHQQLRIPGVAVGIVQDGEVVFAEGFGVREVGKPWKVDADTRFMIASVTKPLTTLMLAKLVEQGKFDWSTPVTRLLPTFQVGDATLSRQLQVKHMVCACTGLPRQDMERIFQSENATPKTVLRRLATMQPTSKLGELFQYSNPMAAAAGFIGGHVLYPDQELGAAYDTAMQTLVFGPLSMSATTFDHSKARRGNYAESHSVNVEGDTVPAGIDLNRTTIPGRPSGGAWSNVNDMLRYVQMELAGGQLPDGRRYIDAAPLLERRVPQVSMGKDAGYGMGLMVDTVRGIRVVHHDGSLSGYRSDVWWLPDQNVGAVILVNSDSGGYLRGPFRRRVLELLFDGKPEAASVSAQAKQLVEAGRTSGSPCKSPPIGQKSKSWPCVIAIATSATSKCRVRASRPGSTSVAGGARWRRCRATMVRYRSSLFRRDGKVLSSRPPLEMEHPC